MLRPRQTNLSSRPPKDNKISTVDQEKLTKFILSAEKVQSSDAIAISHELTPIKDKLPWEKEGIRDDLNKIFNLRLSEPYFLKLDYVAKALKVSKHQLCLDILLTAIDKELNNL